MSDPMVLRTATLADADAIAVFHTDCWNEAYRGMVPQDYLDRVTAEVRAIRWRERLVSDVRRTCAALREDRLIGIVSWGPSHEADLPALELMSLYVAQHSRGSGVADMEVAIGSAPAHLVVFEENLRAQSFYQKHGFAADGYQQLDADTGVPEVRMVRR